MNCPCVSCVRLITPEVRCRYTSWARFAQRCFSHVFSLPELSSRPRPQERGELFSWGDIQSKADYTPGNTILYGELWYSIDALRSDGIIDKEGNLTREYDAAAGNWGGEWRMPSSAEMEEGRDSSLTARCFNDNGVALMERYSGLAVRPVCD